MRTLGNIQHSSEDLVEIQKHDAIILDHCVSQLPEANFSTLAKVDLEKNCNLQIFKYRRWKIARGSSSGKNFPIINGTVFSFKLLQIAIFYHFINFCQRRKMRFSKRTTNKTIKKSLRFFLSFSTCLSIFCDKLLYWVHIAKKSL